MGRDIAIIAHFARLAGVTHTHTQAVRRQTEKPLVRLIKFSLAGGREGICLGASWVSWLDDGGGVVFLVGPLAPPFGFGRGAG